MTIILLIQRKLHPSVLLPALLSGYVRRNVTRNKSCRNRLCHVFQQRNGLIYTLYIINADA
jgi:hypothetical protein